MLTVLVSRRIRQKSTPGKFLRVGQRGVRVKKKRKMTRRGFKLVVRHEEQLQLYCLVPMKNGTPLILELCKLPRFLLKPFLGLIFLFALLSPKSIMFNCGRAKSWLAWPVLPKVIRPKIDLLLLPVWCFIYMGYMEFSAWSKYCQLLRLFGYC